MEQWVSNLGSLMKLTDEERKWGSRPTGDPRMVKMTHHPEFFVRLVVSVMLIIFLGVVFLLIR